jgi:biopolymer transport protein ExbB
MSQLEGVWEALKFGGAMVYPLLALGALALIIILDRAVANRRALVMPRGLLQLIETYGFRWEELERELDRLSSANCYGSFFTVIAANRGQPAWWVESRAGDEAGRIEKRLGRGLWVLETIVTAAPLMGLLGTITGMMQSFRVIGASSLIAPTQVTAGVAQALIATALGLLIAIIALFGYNFFSRTQSYALSQMERLGSRLTDHIRLDQESIGESEARVVALATNDGARAR